MLSRLSSVMKPRVKIELLNKLGRDKISEDEEDLQFYQEDYTEHEISKPDFIVKATTTEEIIDTIKICSRYTIPVIPAVQNTNVGALCIPESGGVILDLRNMNKIIKVDEENKYMIIEPGVSFGQIKEYLDKNHPNYRFAYPLSPPHTSALAGCILDGLGNLSLKHGAMSSWINGLEVVLGDATVVKTGSCALTEHWVSRAPLPDLTGIFVNSQGTTGVVTKMAVKIWDKMPLSSRFFVLSYDIDSTYKLIKEFVRLELCDDIGALSWTTGKMLFGIDSPIVRDENEPIFFIYLELSSPNERMHNLKIEMLSECVSQFPNGIFDGPIKLEEIIGISSEFSKFAEFPTELDFLSKYKGGGLTWLGCYGPYSNLADGVKEGMALMEKCGFPPTVVSRPMHGGHFGILRFIIRFDKKDHKMIANIKDMYIDMLKLCIDKGYIPYKTPLWVKKSLKAQWDTRFLKLFEEIRKLVDPRQIMNSGKWDF